MKSRIMLTTRQTKEIKQQIGGAYQKGCVDGSKKTLLFALCALDNLYGWTGPTMKKLISEIMRMIEESAHDQVALDRMMIVMQEKGIDFKSGFFTHPELAKLLEEDEQNGLDNEVQNTR